MRQLGISSGTLLSLCCVLLAACASDGGGPGDGGGATSGGTTGGAASSGGAAGTGGTTGAVGGAGGPAAGGQAATGGWSGVGGSGAGGGAVGGNATGGSAVGGSASGGGASGGSGAGGGATGGGMGSGGTTAILPEPDCGAPIDLGVRIVGRHDGCDASGVRMSWSGTGFVARLNGDGLTFSQSGNAVQYSVFVDSVSQPNLVTQDGDGTYTVASGLGAGEHVVEVYRRGEASFGTVTLRAVEAVGGALLPPTAPARRLEIFGDSITCGYGNEGDSASCSFSADTENHTLAYGALLARHFGAELSTVAWSGKGVVINYGGDTSTTLPEMLDRADPNSASSVWDYRAVAAPQAVVINLGTNDYSTDNDPTDEEFVNTYGQMVDTLRARYPDTYLVCTLGPLLSGSDLDRAWTNIESVVNQRRDAGDTRIEAFPLEASNPSPGCDYHPSLMTHQRMAEQLVPVLEQALGW